MGQINKNANLYDKDGKLIAQAPLKSLVNQGAPLSHKYPGNNFRLK